MTDLTEFLKSKIATEKKEQVNLENIKKQWLEDLKSLYNKIREWTKEAQNEGLIQINEYQIDLNEEGLGNYQAPALTLIISQDKIEIRPIGRSIIGGKGRVDVSSRKAAFMLILLDKGWLLVKEKQSRERVTLTENIFTSMLKDLLT
jgi:hypothetical protein